MSVDGPNLVDWLTLAAATVGTFLTAIVAIWSVWRKDREVFDAHIEWEFHGYGPYPELAFVYLNNRSSHSLSVIELSWAFGAFRRLPEKGTAAFYEDPTDLAFPYEVKPGESRKIYLNEDGAKTAFKKVEKTADRYGKFRRSSIWLKIKTMRGTVRYVGAERALPWTYQPSWITGETGEEVDD